MSVTKYDLVLLQGSDETRVFVLQDPDGVPVNLFDCSVACQVRDTYYGKVILEPVISVVPEAGSITVHFPAAATTALDRTGLKLSRVSEGSSVGMGYVGVYDIEVTFADHTTVKRVIQGQACVVPEVTLD